MSKRQNPKRAARPKVPLVDPNAYEELSENGSSVGSDEREPSVSDVSSESFHPEEEGDNAIATLDEQLLRQHHHDLRAVPHAERYVK